MSSFCKDCRFFCDRPYISDESNARVKAHGYANYGKCYRTESDRMSGKNYATLAVADTNPPGHTSALLLVHPQFGCVQFEGK